MSMYLHKYILVSIYGSVGFTLLLGFNVVVSVHSVIIILSKTIFKGSTSSASSKTAPAKLKITNKIAAETDITKIASPVDNVKITDYLKDANNASGSDQEDQPVDSLASEPSKALFVKKRNKKKANKKSQQ